MQRFTISLDDSLAAQFDELIAQRGYESRSEAVRDLIREKLGSASLDNRLAAWCVASVSYVYDHHEQTVTARVLGLQHDHHDLVITSLHTHLDHDHCLETVVLRGPSSAVTTCAQQLVALRGVRHGNIHIVPLAHAPHAHSHGHGQAASGSAFPGARHTHYKPIS